MGVYWIVGSDSSSLKPGSSSVSVGGKTRSPQTACACARAGAIKLRETASAAPLGKERGMKGLRLYLDGGDARGSPEHAGLRRRAAARVPRKGCGTRAH